MALISAVLAWHARADARVAARQRVAQGTVVAHEPEYHNRYWYTFGAGGRVYRGWDSPIRDSLRVGQSVAVYYDPADPATNALTDFDTRTGNALGPASVLACAVVSLLAYVFVARRRARRGPRRSLPEPVAQRADRERRRDAG